MDTEKAIVTESNDEARLLPETQRPVRGADGVSVRVATLDIPERAVRLMMRAEGEWHTYPPMAPDETELKEAVVATHRGLCRAVKATPKLHERIHLSGGYKTHSGDEARQLVAQKNDDETNWDITLRLAVGGRLQRALDDLGFDPRNPEAFDRWEAAVAATVESVRALVERTHWTYDVVALLNAPPIDTDIPIPIADTALDGQDTTVTIEAASDKLLSRFIDGPYNFAGSITGVYTSPVNSALRLRLALPVEAPEADYLAALGSAAELFARIVDVLRLVYTGDLGIVGVEPVPVDFDAPAIRSFNAGHNPTFAGILPRRTFFFQRSTTPLSEKEVAELRAMLPLYLDGSHGVEGLDIAVRRYRDSRERHRPGDPESLLDLTAAYEALILNDGGQGELSYRLALRVARLSGGSFEDRHIIFEILRGMYGARSRLAHGATLDSMKQIDRERVQAALDLGPAIFRWIVRHFLVGEGPSHLRNRGQGRALTHWWRSVELGDDSPFTADNVLFGPDQLDYSDDTGGNMMRDGNGNPDEN